MELIFDGTFWLRAFQAAGHWVVTELPSLVIIILVATVLIKIIKYAINKTKTAYLGRVNQKDETDSFEVEKRVNTLMSILYGLIRVVLIVLLSIIILEKIGVNIAPLLASVGIIGLAVGFGAQELVRDYISGFFILLENQVRTGDVAIINGTGGLVESIELRTITLRDLAGVVHVFQNGKINTLSNMTKEWSAVVLNIGVAYKEDVDRVMELIQQTGDELYSDPEFSTKMIEPIEVSGLDEFAASAVVIRARIKTKPAQQWVIGREYRRRLKKSFDSNNIEIPFPHTTIYWGEETGPLKIDAGKS